MPRFRLKNSVEMLSTTPAASSNMCDSDNCVSPSSLCINMLPGEKQVFINQFAVKDERQQFRRNVDVQISILCGKKTE